MSDGVYNWKNDEVGSVLATTHGLPWIADLNDIEDPDDFIEDYPNFATDNPYGKYITKWVDVSFLFSQIGFTDGKNSNRRFLIADSTRTVAGIPWGNYTCYDVPYYGWFDWTSSNTGETKSVHVLGYTVRRNMSVPVRINPDNTIRPWHKWENLSGTCRKFVTRKGSGTNIFRLDTDDHYARFRYDPDGDTVKRMFYTPSQNGGTAETTWVQDNASHGPTMIMDIQAGGGGGGGSGGSKDDGMYDGDANCSCGGGGGGAGAFVSLIIDLTKFHHIEIKTTAGSQYGKHGGNRAGEHDGENGTKGVDVFINFYSNETTISKTLTVNGGAGGLAANADVMQWILDHEEKEKEFAWETSIGGGAGGMAKWTKGSVGGGVQYLGSSYNNFNVTESSSGRWNPSGGNGGCTHSSSSYYRNGEDVAESTSITIGTDRWLRNQTLQNKTKAKAFGQTNGAKCQGGAGAPSVMGHPGERDYNNADTYLTKPTGYGYGGGGGARNGYADTGTSWVDEGQDGGQACIIVYY